MGVLTYFPLPKDSGYWYSSPFGMRTHPVTGERKLHGGTDIAVDLGTHVFASRGGQVTTGYEAGGAGNWLNITSGGITVKFFHLDRYVVRSGTVAAGDHVAYVGNTGVGTGSHLHVEIWDPNRRDPYPDLLAAPFVGATPDQPNKPASEVEPMVIVYNNAGTGYICSGLFKRGLRSPDEAAQWKYMGAKDLGVNEGYLNLLTEIPLGRIDGTN